MKDCVALCPTPLLAVKVSRYVPEERGVPDKTPVAPLKVTPDGNRPLLETVGGGVPMATTVNVPKALRVKVV